MINKTLIYPELSYKIIGIFYEIQNELGTKFQEKHFCRAIESKFIESRTPYQKEVPLKVYYRDKLLGEFKADFIIANKIILEIKTTNRLTSDHIRQMLRYLKAANLKLGLIINFRIRPLEVKRVVNLY